jgi:tetratricopeptide (TPR) repeat protein/DNA-binding CsgD family transcriptional regulator
MASEPDSARIIIKEILSYKGKLHDTIYGSTYLAYAYYHHLKNNTDSSFYYYDRAQSFINGQKYPKLYARLLRNKAATYKKRGENEKSLQILAEAEDIYRSIDDETGLAIAYGEIASNYNILLRTDEGINYLLKAIAILEKKNDKTHLLSIKLSLANTYLNSGNLEFAADLYKEGLKACKEQNAVKNYSVTLLNYGDCLTRQKKYAEAQKVLNDALPGLKKFNDQDIIGIVYSKLGTIQVHLNHLKAAESYYQIAFRKALENKSIKTISIGTEYIEILNKVRKHNEALEVITLIDKPAILQKANVADKAAFEAQKAKVYQYINNTDKAIISLENSLKLQDTLKQTANRATTLKLQQEFQSKYQKKKGESLKSVNMSLKQKLYESRKSTLIPFLGVCLLLLVITLIYIFRLRAHNKKLAIAKTKKEQLLKEYENTKNLNLTDKESLENKKQELATGIVSLTSLEGNISRLIALCKENPCDLNIESIKGQLESLTSEDDYWTLFRKRFSETYAGFQENLQKNFPALTQKDLFFCSMLKLNLPYKDMATLMQISPETIVKKKYRVKKKMGIETESELESILLNTAL